jgi:hypothetical protein
MNNQYIRGVLNASTKSELMDKNKLNKNVRVNSLPSSG